MSVCLSSWFLVRSRALCVDLSSLFRFFCFSFFASYLYIFPVLGSRVSDCPPPSPSQALSSRARFLSCRCLCRPYNSLVLFVVVSPPFSSPFLPLFLLSPTPPILPSPPPHLCPISSRGKERKRDRQTERESEDAVGRRAPRQSTKKHYMIRFCILSFSFLFALHGLSAPVSASAHTALLHMKGQRSREKMSCTGRAPNSLRPAQLTPLQQQNEARAFLS